MTAKVRRFDDDEFVKDENSDYFGSVSSFKNSLNETGFIGNTYKESFR